MSECRTHFKFKLRQTFRPETYEIPDVITLYSYAMTSSTERARKLVILAAKNCKTPLSLVLSSCHPSAR